MRTVKVKVGTGGHVFPQNQASPVGPSGQGAYTIEVTGVPKDVTMAELIRVVERTAIVGGIYSVPFSALGPGKIVQSRIEKTVADIRLPMVKQGFRTGWATAVVDGVPMRVYTSQHATMPSDAHEADIRRIFEQGGGEPVKGSGSETSQ